jgi:hypothetical protein
MIVGTLILFARLRIAQFEFSGWLSQLRDPAL